MPTELCKCGHGYREDHYRPSAESRPRCAICDCKSFLPADQPRGENHRTLFCNMKGCDVPQKSGSQFCALHTNAPRAELEEDTVDKMVRDFTSVDYIVRPKSKVRARIENLLASARKESYEEGAKHNPIWLHGTISMSDAKFKQEISQALTAYREKVDKIFDTVKISEYIGATEDEKRVAEYLMTFWNDNLRPKILSAIHQLPIDQPHENRE